jgi:hypothetical protein
MLASCFQPRLGAIVRPTKINHPSTRPKKKKKKEKKNGLPRPLLATHKLSIAH